VLISVQSGSGPVNLRYRQIGSKYWTYKFGEAQELRIIRSSRTLYNIIIYNNNMI
jgi:hypothetical protein